MARKLKSGLVAWRYLSERTRASEVRKYGSVKAAQSARRALPTQKLKPRARERFVKQYGGVREATIARRQQIAQRRVEREQRPPVVYNPPVEPVEPSEPEEYEGPSIEEQLDNILFDRAWDVYNGAPRMNWNEWMRVLQDQLGVDWKDAKEGQRYYYHSIVQTFVDQYGPRNQVA